MDGTTIAVRIEDVLAPLSGFSSGNLLQVRYIGMGFSKADAEKAHALNSLLVGGKQVFLELEKRSARRTVLFSLMLSWRAKAGSW